MASATLTLEGIDCQIGLCYPGKSWQAVVVVSDAADPAGTHQLRKQSYAVSRRAPSP
jgi:hypothetical protein